MTSERGGPDTCPLRCRLRRGAGDAASTGAAADQVDWAGLPVNLDLVFSQQQRDKVYGQYLRRRRGPQLWRWSENGLPCPCDIAAGEQPARKADSMSSR